MLQLLSTRTGQGQRLRTYLKTHPSEPFNACFCAPGSWPLLCLRQDAARDPVLETLTGQPGRVFEQARSKF